jgi:hypothetical protein
MSGARLAVLHNAAGNLGISLGFNIQQLPVLSLWKNTDTMGQGYVTGLEPGTSWAYNRSYQRALNRVPTIGPKEQRRFDITYTFLPDKAAVDQGAAKGTDHPAPASNRDARDPLGRSSQEGVRIIERRCETPRRPLLASCGPASL